MTRIVARSLRFRSLVRPVARPGRSAGPQSSRRGRLLARLRGHQTLERARRAGLQAPGPLYIGANVYIDHGFAWAVSIGARTTIAHDVRIIAHDAATKGVTGYTEVVPVTIGERCYVGAGVILLPGATLGDGAIVGAGSVVRGEIPAGALAAGNPARVIGSVEEFAARHERLQATSACFEQDAMADPRLTALREALAEHGRIYVR